MAVVTHLSAAVREEWCGVDHKSDPQQCHGEIRPEVRAAVEAPHVGDDGLEELKHHHGEDEELDGQPVDLVIVLDLARSVDPGAYRMDCCGLDLKQVRQELLWSS